MIHRYDDGASLRDLADTYQVSTGTVRDRLLAAGVRLRRRGAARVDIDLVELVYQTHLSGSGRAAAEVLGVGRSTASRRLAELHGRRQPRAEQPGRADRESGQAC